MEYKYTYKLRGFSIGCQPSNKFLRWLDDGLKFETIFYDRELSKKEIEHYELIDLNRNEIYNDKKNKVYAKDYELLTKFNDEYDDTRYRVISENGKKVFEVDIPDIEIHTVKFIMGSKSLCMYNKKYEMWI
jgi:hypothetical protein